MVAFWMTREKGRDLRRGDLWLGGFAWFGTLSGRFAGYIASGTGRYRAGRIATTSGVEHPRRDRAGRNPVIVAHNTSSLCKTRPVGKNFTFCESCFFFSLQDVKERFIIFYINTSRMARQSFIHFKKLLLYTNIK